MTDIQQLTYVLATIAGKMYECSADIILENAKSFFKEEENEERNGWKKEISQRDVQALYELYPSKCPISGRNTGKNSRDKQKLMKLLRDKERDSIAAYITKYLEDCAVTKTYIKNFSTFLNTIPTEVLEQKKERREKPIYQ